MKTEQIVILVVAFFLGMLLLNMVKNVCGCDVVEGLNPIWGNDYYPTGTALTASMQAAFGTCTYLRSCDNILEEAPGQSSNVCEISAEDGCISNGNLYQGISNLNTIFTMEEDEEPVCTSSVDNWNDFKEAWGCAPEEPTCTSYPEMHDGYTITDGLLDTSSCAPGYTGNATSTCETEPEWTLDGCVPGCSTFDSENCPNPFYTVDGSQICGAGSDLSQCNEDTCCTTFDSTKWVEDSELLINSFGQFNLGRTSGDPAFNSCDSRSGGGTYGGPGCSYPFVYSTGRGCAPAPPDLTSASLSRLVGTGNLTLCKPADSATAQLICPTPTPTR